jgi:hypothetical protein
MTFSRCGHRSGHCDLGRSGRVAEGVAESGKGEPKKDASGIVGPVGRGGPVSAVPLGLTA